jgi:uncharacterized protein CbrC (UPF0167 family)
MADDFAGLGIPLPLFAAPAKEAAEYLGAATCSVCGAEAAHCFRVDDVITNCPACGAPNTCRPATKAAWCRSCRHPMTLPVSRGEPVACYGCIRAGRAAFTKDTVLGMVTWEHAVEGLTHGAPGLHRGDVELVPSEEDPDWLRARVPPKLLLELVRTPSYITWQGEQWQFCCGGPAVYLGEWKEAEFGRRARDGNGRALFERAAVDGLDARAWGRFGAIGGPYMFGCPACGRLLGHFDMD